MDSDIADRVRFSAQEHDIEVKTVELRGETLFVETKFEDKSVPVTMFAALLFDRFSDETFEEVAIRNVDTGNTEHYDVNRVLEHLIQLVDESELSDRS